MQESIESILIVDDDELIRHQLARALETVGLASECAVNGDDALVRYLHRRHSIVVTDLRMPELHGHSLATSLLKLPDPPNIVVLTGVTNQRLAKDLIARGVTDVVFKPIDCFKMADSLKSLLVDRSNDNHSETSVAHSSSDTASSIAQQGQGLSGRTDERARLEDEFQSTPPPHKWLMSALEWIDRDRVPDPSAELLSTLRTSTTTTSNSLDRRTEQRFQLNETAVVLELNSRFEPMGAPTKVVVRDISTNGIGLRTSSTFSAPYIAVSWIGLNKDPVCVVGSVIRRREVSAGAYEMGALLAKFNE